MLRTTGRRGGSGLGAVDPLAGAEADAVLLTSVWTASVRGVWPLAGAARRCWVRRVPVVGADERKRSHAVV